MTDFITDPSAAARSGEVEIVEIALFPRGSDDYIDIQAQIAEINLYGDLFSPFYSASLTMLDNIGVLHTAPIVGEETVVITLKSSSFQTNETISKVFKVYSVKDFNVDGEYNNLFNIELVSFMGHTNNLIHIDRKFSGECTEIVKDIVEEYLMEPCLEIAEQVDHSENRPAKQSTEDMFNFFLNTYVARPSINDIQFISNRWTPAYTINWISQKAIAESNSGPETASFIFNEGFKNITYDTLDNLFFVGRLRADPKHNQNGLYRLEYLPTAETRNPAIKAMTIVDVSFKRFSDALRSHSIGGLASSLESYDIVSKRYHKQNLDWVSLCRDYAQLEDFEDTEFGHFPSSGKDKGLFHPFIPRSFDTRKFSVIKHNQLHDGLFSYIPERIVQLRNFQFASLEHINLDITIYGRFDIEAGHVVHLTFPVNKSNPDGSRLATYISGYYFVLAVRHKITHTEHFTYLEVAKESTQMREFE